MLFLIEFEGSNSVLFLLNLLFALFGFYYNVGVFIRGNI